MVWKNKEEQLNKVCKAYKELRNKDLDYLKNLKKLRTEYSVKLSKIQTDLNLKFPVEYKYLSRSREFAPHRINSIIEMLIKLG